MTNHEDSTPPFVLFADDNPDTLGFLALQAKFRGYRCDTASTAEEMLEKINKHCGELHSCYDLVVGDLCYQTPGSHLDGLSALREIRKKFPDLPFIFLSARMDAMTKVEARRLGANYQEKPIDPEPFFDRLDSILLMTRATYHGEERRRRSWNQTEFSRRKDDLGYLDNVQLQTPPALHEAQQLIKAQTASRLNK